MNELHETMAQTKLGEFHVRVVGSGAPAVLWHSLFVDSRTWERVEPMLGKERTLVLIDGPGHGHSNAPDHRFTLEDCAEAALEVLAQLGIIDAVDWVGNAWGGQVGIVFAASHPDRCRTLVTLGTPVDRLRGMERASHAIETALYRAGLPDRFVRGHVVASLLSKTTRDRDAETVDLVLDGLRSTTRQGLYLAVRSVHLGRPDLRPVLSRITTPTLFVTGGDDAMWTSTEAPAAGAQMSNGRSAAIPSARHLPQLEDPEAVADLIHDFWNTPTPSKQES